MAKDEKLKANTITASSVEDTFKVRGDAHIVSESEESINRRVNVHADRAVKARGRELNFFRRMAFGYTEAYNRLQARRQMRDVRHGGTYAGDWNSLTEEAAQVENLRLSEAAEAEALVAVASIDTEHIYKEGEVTTVLDMESAQDDEQSQFVERANEIVRQYVLGNYNGATLRTQTETLVNDINTALPGLFSETPIASDLQFLAEEAREAYLSHFNRLANVEVELQLCLGQIAGGIDTGENRDLLDGLVEWAERGTVSSRLINPVTVGIGTGVTFWAIKVPAKAVPLIGGAAAGLFSAFRRIHKEKIDRNLFNREEEAGYLTPEPNRGEGIARVVDLALAATDFREFSLDPASALTEREWIQNHLDVTEDVIQSEDWQNQALVRLADLRSRWDISKTHDLGLIRYGERRNDNGDLEFAGTAQLNEDRRDLMVSMNALQRQLEKSLGNDFGQRFAAEYSTASTRLVEGLGQTDSRFRGNQLRKALRSGLFAFATGAAVGYATDVAGDFIEKGIEKGVEKVSDILNLDDDKQIEIGETEVPLSENENLRTILEAKQGSAGLSLEVPEGYIAAYDENLHVLHLTGPSGNYEFPYDPSLPADQLKDNFETSLREQGLSGDIGVDAIQIPGPEISSAELILSPEYLREHNLVDITNTPHNVSFGHAYDRLEAGEYEYNELTLYRDNVRDWSFGPLGLNGEAVQPFVYADEAPWVDPHLAANAPVNSEHLVPIYQLNDTSGVTHTLIGGQSGNNFEIPSEFINKNGEIDGVSIVGYGMAEDASGKIINGNEIFSNPQLIHDGNLHFMASVPFEQNPDGLVPELIDVKALRVEDLAGKIPVFDSVDGDGWKVDVPDLPPLVIPLDPRIFPERGVPEPLPLTPDGDITVYIPGYYGMTPGEAREKYRSSISETLKENPAKLLDASQEAKLYMDSWPEARQKDVEKAASEIPAISPEAKIVVAIPVASSQEGKSIYKTLENYAKQKNMDGEPLNPETFEVLLHLNRVKKNKPDRTESEVSRFTRDYPEINVRVINRVYKERKPMGYLRRLISDVVIKRASDAGLENDLIIVSNDADAIDISEKYLASLIKTFDGTPTVDAALGKIELWDEVLKKYPVFYASNRFIQFIDTALRHESEGTRNHASSGANYAYRSSVYSAVGGYGDERVGEDVILGLKIKIARTNENGTIPLSRYPVRYVGPAKISTNPRRGLAKYLKGEPVVTQWDDFETADYVREFGVWEQIQGAEDGFDIKRLEHEINTTIKAYRLEPDSKPVRRALEFLKIDYKVEDGLVKIESTDRLEALFNRFSSGEITAEKVLPEGQFQIGLEGLAKPQEAQVNKVPLGWSEQAAAEFRELESMEPAKRKEYDDQVDAMNEKLRKVGEIAADARITSRASMSPDTKAIFTVPITTDAAAGNIERIVELIEKQKSPDGGRLKPNEYEIYLYLAPQSAEAKDKALEKLTEIFYKKPEIRVIPPLSESKGDLALDQIYAMLRMVSLFRKFKAVRENRVGRLVSEQIPIIRLNVEDEVDDDELVVREFELLKKQLRGQQANQQRRIGPVTDFTGSRQKDEERIAKLRANHERDRDKALAEARKNLDRIKKERLSKKTA